VTGWSYGDTQLKGLATVSSQTKPVGEQLNLLEFLRRGGVCTIERDKQLPGVKIRMRLHAYALQFFLLFDVADHIRTGYGQLLVERLEEEAARFDAEMKSPGQVAYEAACAKHRELHPGSTSLQNTWQQQDRDTHEMSAWCPGRNN
jgi:hypothetical protein